MTENKSTSKIVLIGWLLVAVSAAFIIVILLLFLAKSDVSNTLPIDPAIFGQYGDIIGGVAGTFVALVGVLFLYETLTLQRRQIREQQNQFNQLKDADKIKEELRISDLENYLRSTINDLAIPIDKQIAALERFIADLKVDYEISHNPEYITSLNGNNISWISYTDRYKIFVTRREKNDTEIFRELNNQLKYIDTIQDSIQSNFKYFKEIKDRYTLQWNTNIREVGLIKDLMITTYQIANTQTPQNPSVLLLNVNKIFVKWTTLENFREMKIAAEQLLIPLQTLCRQTDGNPDAIKLLQPINDCLLAHQSIINIKTFISVESEFLIIRLRESKTVFLNTVEALTNNH